MPVSAMDLIYNHEDAERTNSFLQRIALAMEKQAGEATLSTLEQEIATAFDLARDGKVYRTRFYFFSTNTSSVGTKMDDNEGMAIPTPATDKSAGSDPYLDREVFKWFRCNYTRDEDGTARVTNLKGRPGYREAGAYDVGTLAMTFYWVVDVKEQYYDIILSDSPHPELGLVPWVDAVKADGTILPYYIESAYNSVTASDGLLRSQPGAAPAYNQCYNNMITNYQKKGAGYWGAGVSRDTLLIIMLAIKYATKNSQKYFTGTTYYNSQSNCAVAENGVKRVLLASQGAFVEGGCVSVGVKDGTNADRGLAKIHSIVDRKKIKSIETVSVGGKNYIALNLDVDTTFDTTTDSIVSTMPQWTGWTDDVIGMADGSPASNTDGKHPYRIHGIEYATGIAMIYSDTVMEFNADYSRSVYVAPKGVTHVQNARTGYKLIGTIPAKDETNSDTWVGDLGFDTENGAHFPVTLGSGEAVGVGDRIWAGGKGTGLREYYTCGALGVGAYAGAGCVYCGLGLGGTAWNYGSAD